MATTIRFRGSGPGPQTPDGCSVELWKLLPAGKEPSLIASAVPPKGSILELGAGVGRITHPLLALGYSVTAVDNSPEMLAEIRAATTVLSDIEDLSLGISFDAVILGSFLIHAPAPGTRAALLQVCRRHVKASGVVLVEHYRHGWPAGAVPGFMGEKDGIKVFVDDVVHDGRFVGITLRHEAANGTWTQSFTVETLDASALHAALTHAALSFERHLDQDESWLLARPVS
jgi:2-polyprenyl-3-methyl-5-hydroxy-6-metoxy-1,4-benzoquinol methylase